MSARLDATAPPSHSKSLASADLPRRVRAALERLFALGSDTLSRQLDLMLSDFEQQLFKLAEQARNPALQAGYFETLRRVRLHRSDVVPHFLGGLEEALAGIRDPAASPEDGTGGSLDFDELRLVDDSEVSEEGVLRNIALRHESRAGLPLLLLGQRFGVLAGAPAFDAETLPVGPHRLGKILAEASRTLQLEAEHRLLLFDAFNTRVMAGYAQLVEAMNALLARENVLPGLSYVPLRSRPTEQEGGREEDMPEASTRAAPPPPSGQAPGPAPAQRPHTRWLGESAGEGDTGAAGGNDENIALSMLQDLLSNRRELVGKLRNDGADRKHQLPLETPAVVDALAARQAEPPSPSKRPRTIGDLKQALLAQGRQQHGKAIRLSGQDEDTFELLGMLYTEIGRELRQGTFSNALLEQLQVPLLRLALMDRAFFVRSQHPARQLLNAVAEAGAKWLDEDESDPKLERQLRQAVDHVVENYHGDSNVFETANEGLQAHLQTLARKAELSERRHVEAARGKEKLVIAKRRAAEFIGEATDGQDVPRFLRNLLDQAWADVLTLTLLRHGEDSEEWTRHASATRELAAAGAGRGAASEGLDVHVEQALTQVGYHQDEATAISRHLTGGQDASSEDPASRTELAMKVKARARLGDDTATPKAKVQPPRNPREQSCYEHLRTLPFGTWMEFSLNQQGDMVRRRIAWFSTVTDRVLFVNQRGQRVDEQSLDQVARLMAQGQAKVVTADRGRLVDRAWAATLNALRNFAGMPNQPQGATP